MDILKKVLTAIAIIIIEILLLAILWPLGFIFPYLLFIYNRYDKTTVLLCLPTIITLIIMVFIGLSKT